MTQRDHLVACARTFLDVRFKHQGRHPQSGLDCLGLLIATAQKSGLTFHGMPPAALDNRQYGARPDTNYLQTALKRYLRPVSEPQLGDVLLLNIEGRPQHLALVSDYPMNEQLGMIHAYAMARKVVEHRLDERWRNAIHRVFRIPSLVEDR